MVALFCPKINKRTLLLHSLHRPSSRSRTATAGTTACLCRLPPWPAWPSQLEAELKEELAQRVRDGLADVGVTPRVVMVGARFHPADRAVGVDVRWLRRADIRYDLVQI